MKTLGLWRASLLVSDHLLAKSAISHSTGNAIIPFPAQIKVSNETGEKYETGSREASRSPEAQRKRVESTPLPFDAGLSSIICSCRARQRKRRLPKKSRPNRMAARFPLALNRRAFSCSSPRSLSRPRGDYFRPAAGLAAETTPRRPAAAVWWSPGARIFSLCYRPIASSRALPISDDADVGRLTLKRRAKEKRREKRDRKRDLLHRRHMFQRSPASLSGDSPLVKYRQSLCSGGPQTHEERLHRDRR